VNEAVTHIAGILHTPPSAASCQLERHIAAAGSSVSQLLGPAAVESIALHILGEAVKTMGMAAYMRECGDTGASRPPGAHLPGQPRSEASQVPAQDRSNEERALVVTGTGMALQPAEASSADVTSACSMKALPGQSTVNEQAEDAGSHSCQNNSSPQHKRKREAEACAFAIKREKGARANICPQPANWCQCHWCSSTSAGACIRMACHAAGASSKGDAEANGVGHSNSDQASNGDSAGVGRDSNPSVSNISAAEHPATLATAGSDLRIQGSPPT
jgi:hypothetical protein